MPELLMEVTESNFEEKVLAGKKPVLVDFWASWCATCQVMAPVISNLALQFEDRVIIAKCNADDNQNLVKQYGITSIPTILIFTDGKPVECITDAMPQKRIAETITLMLQNPEGFRAKAPRVQPY